jgi:hypothetical protein
VAKSGLEFVLESESEPELELELEFESATPSMEEIANREEVERNRWCAVLESSSGAETGDRLSAEDCPNAAGASARSGQAHIKAHVTQLRLCIRASERISFYQETHGVGVSFLREIS